MITGAEAIVVCLEREGVTTVFGYPGATICPVYDALSRSEIRHILVRQEQNAGHAANGYARISQRPGVCLATSGPGATNLITALATAYMDSVPLVAITGQVPRDQLGRDVFQEADITGAAEPFTKHTFLVKRAGDIPRVMKEAFYIAGTGRQGPVLVDVPLDVQHEPVEFFYPESVEIRGYKPSRKGNKAQLGRVLDAMSCSRRPVLCVGGGVFGAQAQEEVRRLAESCSIPVVSTLMGLGVMPSEHPLFFGMLGMYGSAAANRAIEQSDLLLVIGARVGDRAMANPGVLQKRTRVVHIDIDPAEIGKVMESNIPLVGDAKVVLEQILENCPPMETAGWLDQLRHWVRDGRSPEEPEDGFVCPHRLLSELSRRMGDGSIYVADVGQNQIWSARSAVLGPGSRFLTSGGMGTMGYSVPAAMGAKLAAPERQVVAVCGDGSFQMQMMELATLRQHKIDLKIVVLRNNRLGMIREIQESLYGGRDMANDLAGSPDFAALARLYGMESAAICSDSQIIEAVDRLLGSRSPALLECLVDPQRNLMGRV